MKYTSFLLTVVLSIATAFIVSKYTSTSMTSVEQRKETAFERVQRTQTIRCAYALAGPPRFLVDPNTGKLSGTEVEIIEAIGKTLNLKVEWSENTDYGAFAENLRSGKQDVFCTTVWASSARAYKILLTEPIFFTPVYAYAREDDKRFDHNINLLNEPSSTISIMDGSTADSIASIDFSKAKRFALPFGAASTDTMMNVVLGKADAVFYDESNVLSFNKNNPEHKLRRIPADKPLRVYGEVFSVGMGEWELRELIDTAIQELQSNGTIDRIFAKYEAEYGKTWRSAGPYFPVINEREGTAQDPPKGK